MELKVKKYILIGAIIYLGYIGWYFQNNQGLIGIPWHPSNVYKEVRDVPTTNASTTPTADQIFDAKMHVPMKSTQASRRARTKAIHTQSQRLARSVTPRAYTQSTRKKSITAVGEGLHTVSNAKFRSFGAWGLINPAQYNRAQRRAKQQQEEQQTPMMYMMFPAPNQDASNMQGGTQSMMIPPYIHPQH